MHLRLMRIAHSVKSLLLCWYFLMSSPEPQPTEKLMMKIQQKLIEFRRLDVADSDMKLKICSSASIAANSLLYVRPLSWCVELNETE